jgi:hypothetical protein
MSNSCLICLKNTKTKQCNNCSMRCHNSCWEKYMKYSKKSEDKLSLECPQCKLIIRIKNTGKGVQTRSVIEKQKFAHIENKIRGFMNKFEYLSVIIDKRIVMLEMFEYISNNMTYLEHNPNFAESVQKKLLEFILTDDDSGCWKRMQTIIFGEVVIEP